MLIVKVCIKKLLQQTALKCLRLIVAEQGVFW